MFKWGLGTFSFPVFFPSALPVSVIVSLIIDSFMGGGYPQTIVVVEDALGSKSEPSTMFVLIMLDI